MKEKKKDLIKNNLIKYFHQTGVINSLNACGQIVMGQKL